MQDRRLTQADIKKIEHTISKGERAEVVPVKDGVKVMIVRREEVREK